MKKILSTLFLLLLSFSHLHGSTQSEEFFQQYPKHYQDIVIGKEIFEVGSNLCEPRYELIKPILNQYTEPFSVLDIGACEGYFSFRIANEYPANCHMIEGGVYKDKPHKLYNLCGINNLSNTFLMNTRLKLQSLQELSQKEHFDVVLAFLVVHQMAEQKHELRESHLEESKKYIEALFALGSDVIIETSTNIYPDLDRYVMDLCVEKNGCYLGEVVRYKKNINNKDTKSKGHLFWFKTRQNKQSTQVISSDIFKELNGVYPEKISE